MAHSHLTEGRRWSRWQYAALALLLLIAAVLRLWSLGHLSLEVDEGIQGLVVQGWLRDGLPILPSGIVYQRAIPFGALQALSATAFGLDEFALRLPAALFGVIAVVSTFLLGRALFGEAIAWTAAIFIALSAWEIELSRYGRFYTAFQVCFTLAVLCFYKGVTSSRRSWWMGFCAASLAAISFHELSVVLLICFVVPLFDRYASRRTRMFALAGAIPFIAAWVGYRRLSRGWFTSLAPPHGYELVGDINSDSSARLSVPGFPDLRLPDLSGFYEITAAQPATFFSLCALTVIAAALVVRSEAPARLKAIPLLLITLALGIVHQFSLAALVLLVYLTLTATSLRAIRGRHLWPVYAALIAWLAFWTLTLGNRVDGGWKPIALALFGFPNLPQHFFYWFALGWPVFLIVISIGGIAMYGRVLRDGDRAMLYLLAAIIGPLAMASTFESYFESRYVFHHYPLLAIIFAWSLLQILSRSGLQHRLQGWPRYLTVGTFLACGFLLSGDVGPISWAAVNRMYSSPRDPMRSIISWRAYAPHHQDQAGPARFVRQQIGSDDRVAALGVPHQLAVYRYYVGRLDVALTRPENWAYQRTRDGRLFDYVTGAELVFDAQKLVSDRARTTTWILGDRTILRDDVPYFAPEVKETARAFVRGATMIGGDSVTFAKKIP